MENVLSLIISLLALIISAVTWFVSHAFSIRRDFANKKKEIRIDYLINAWQLLEGASNREDNKRNIDIESAIAAIQLLGTIKQIELAQSLAEAISKNKEGHSLGLLIELRRDLRSELGLEIAPEKWRFLRFIEK